MQDAIRTFLTFVARDGWPLLLVLMLLVGFFGNKGPLRGTPVVPIVLVAISVLLFGGLTLILVTVSQ